MVAVVLTAGGDGLAVTLAGVGAVLFGLAAVRQHGAVQDTVTSVRGVGQTLVSFSKLVRDRGWLTGTVQAVVAGGLHILALALAPITLVQPIGVLAVPVTVVAAAVRARRRPGRAQIIGAVLSVIGVLALTVLLLTPSTTAVVVPSWVSLSVTVAMTVSGGVAAILLGKRNRPVVRCITLASAAAVLFGVNSILIRTIGHLVAIGSVVANPSLLAAAVAGLAVALPVALWALQSAYISGSAHVVICCLTLLDPLTAVTGGVLLLHDGVTMSPSAIVAAIASAVLAVIGIVFLSLDYPTEPQLSVASEPAEPLVAHRQATG